MPYPNPLPPLHTCGAAEEEANRSFPCAAGPRIWAATGPRPGPYGPGSLSSHDTLLALVYWSRGLLSWRRRSASRRRRPSPGLRLPATSVPPSGIPLPSLPFPPLRAKLHPKHYRHVFVFGSDPVRRTYLTDLHEIRPCSVGCLMSAPRAHFVRYFLF